MKKAISIILALVMTLAVLTACGSSTQPAATSAPAPAANDAAASAEPAKDVRLLKTSLPTAWDETHGYTQALIAMNKYLDEVSGGTLQLDVYAGGQLGDETAIFECLQLGTVDCAIFNAASLSNFTHALEAFDLPYLYTDDEGWANQELQNAVVSSDFARGYLDKVYEETTVHAVGFLYNAARDFFLNKPLDSLADASKIKLRSMTAQMHLDMYTAMGFVATPMGYSEVYNAMQTGVIDGFEDTACSTITSGTYETAKYCVKSGHATASPLFVCSDMVWNSLTAEEQGWLIGAVEVGRQACCDTFVVSQANAYKTFEEKGLKVSVIDRDEARTAVAPVIAKYCENEDYKAVYVFVQELREELGLGSYIGMEDYMDMFA